jgi:DNA-binding NarL/FixJ family response regulator
MSELIITLIVDDHAVVRDGIRRALELRTGFSIHAAASKNEAMAQIATLKPQLIFLDINLPDGNGLELVTWVRSISTRTSIIVLSMHSEDEYVLAAMRAGASAYVNKSEPLPVLLNFMDHALSTPQSFSAHDMAQIIDRDSKAFGLSQREIQILSQLHDGDSLKELSLRLFITESTLKKHLTSIYRKLEVKNRVQAIAKARAAGLLK